MASDQVLAGQIEYYRRRASEYDVTVADDITEASRTLGELIERLAPRGDLLEIASGTGLCTQHLVGLADSITALDSSPETIELARERVGDAVEFIAADIFDWQPPRRFDTVFFSFWLSHVPPARLASFWELLERCLADGGRVLFLDEGAPRASKEPNLRPGEEGLAERELTDGSVHTIVKLFYDPDELERRLEEFGWSAQVELVDQGLIIGTAAPARRGV